MSRRLVLAPVLAACGGDEESQDASEPSGEFPTEGIISRLFVMHVMLLPGLIIALIGAHLYLVVKLGTTAPPWLKAEKSKALAKEEV